LGGRENFAIDHWCEPDMIVCAKGLGSGYTPLYCVITEEKIHSSIQSGTGNFIHGFTYGQNPQSCAVGLAVIYYIEKNNLISRSVQLGSYLLEKLKSLCTTRLSRCPGPGLFCRGGVSTIIKKKGRST